MSVAVATINSRTCIAVKVGLAAMISAATPLTKAAAIDVPLIVTYGSPAATQLRDESAREPMRTVEQIPIPGAVMSM